MRTNSALLVTLDRATGVPLHRQIEATVRDLIRAGQLLFTYLHLAPAPELTRALIKAGATVQVVMTAGAEAFITASSNGSQTS